MPELKPRHYKALELMEDGTLSIKEIAKIVGMSKEHLYDMVEGGDKAGALGHLFQSEIRKVTNRQTAKTRAISKTNAKLAQELLQRELQALKNKETLLDVDRRRLVEMTNSLSKSRPSVEIGSISYSRGLTKEDLIHEFNRLTSIAKSALIKRGVQGSKQAGSRILPALTGTGDPLPEDPETPLLRPESEAGEVSQE